MNAENKRFGDLADIPGTTVFTAALARKGYHLNEFCKSLMKPENRERFKADERAYLDNWPLTETQQAAVLGRDYTSMVAEGGNIYFLVKIGAADGLAVAQIVSSMTTSTAEEYMAMMSAGGRSPEGNRSILDKR